MSDATILIIDDESTFILYEIMLRRQGYVVWKQARTGVEALLMLKQSDSLPNLIIMAHRLDDFRCTDLIRYFRSEPRYQRILVMVITLTRVGEFERELADENITLERRAIIAHPVNFQSLQRDIADMINESTTEYAS